MTDCWTKPICLEMHKADPVFFEQLREVCKNKRRGSPKSALESIRYEDVREKWEPLITPCNSFFKGSCCDCTIPGEEPNAGRCTSYKMLNEDDQIVHVPMCTRDGLSCFDSSPTNCGYVWYLIFFVCCGGCCFFCCQCIVYCLGEGRPEWEKQVTACRDDCCWCLVPAGELHT